MSGFRLGQGGRIDRSKPLRFRFGRRTYAGFAGDTLASALLANGVMIVGRSFKYHRPRGVFTAGPEEPCAIVRVGARPNLKATQVALTDGLEAGPVNCWPGAGFDLGASVGLLKRFMPAGFYYKTFIRPGWRWWEPLIRRAAGLGRLDPEAGMPDGQRRSLHCDVLVVGGGPAGIAAALAAGAEGARVLLVEQDRMLGGSLLASDGAIIDAKPPDAWLADAAATMAARPETRIMLSTTVFGSYDHGLVGAVEGERVLWKIRARRIVLATGAVERPIAFENDDLPGVMLAEAARAYLLRWAVAPGRRLLLFACNDDAYRTALAWTARGLPVTAVVDPRPNPDGPLADRLRAAGVPITAGAVVERALGYRRVSGALIRHAATGGITRAACDVLAVSGGRDPAVNLFVQGGGSLAWDGAISACVPAAGGQGVPVGAAAGAGALGRALADGHAAGAAAANVDAGHAPYAEDEEESAPLAQWYTGRSQARSWVDRASDVTVADAALAAREGYVSVEHYKRYTTSGMSPDQGKSSAVVALAVLGAASGRAPAEVGTTRFRAPWDPVPISALIGQDRGPQLRPVMHLPAHDRHAAAGAMIEEYGGWMRPAAYPHGTESLEAAAFRESAAVRAGVGLFDASPLGKIELRGRDAGLFLDRMYVQRLSTLKPGRLRYAVMATEHGIVFDDGVVARLDEGRFLVGTTSGGAVRVAEAFEEWLQCEWVDLDVLVTPVTHQWGVVNVAGPEARALIAAAGTDIDLTGAAFPHMTFREGAVAGIPARVSRVSFSGELSYEIAVPARRTPELWDRLAAAGPAVPFGIEALMTLRIEKGYVHVGADTDGTTYPADCGFADAVARRTDDFVGRRSMRRPDALAAGRRQLVGLLPEPTDAPVHSGAHIVGTGGRSEGHVTSACRSPAFGRTICLAVLRDGRARTGEIVTLFDLGKKVSARVVPPVFFDPEGARLR
ncbi:MAG: 2Fe-2S iron-sulfur cluster-binding protein [Alphaproteobacteria bacterium]